MADNSWAIDIEPQVYSIIKAKTEKDIKAKYPDVRFTMDDASTTKATYPTIFFNFLRFTELGQDLEGKTVNALYVGVDVRVTVSKTQDLSALRWINTRILNAFKELRFDAKLPQHEQSTVDSKSTVMRFERVIGQGQTL